MSLLFRSLRKFSLDFSKLSSAITTEADRNHTIDAQQPIDGYLTPNASAPHTVIMIHQWWGFNKSMISTANYFSNNNIRVFVPDLYRGAPAIDSQDAGHKMNNLDWPGALSDIKTIKEHFDKSSKSVSVMGFCMGGALTFASLASIPGWKAGGVFYGIPDLNIFRLDKITAKVIAHFGRDDPLKGFSDAESAQKLKADAKKNNYPVDVRIWQGVSHAFCNQDSKYFDEKRRDLAFEITRKVIEE